MTDEAKTDWMVKLDEALNKLSKCGGPQTLAALSALRSLVGELRADVQAIRAQHQPVDESEEPRPKGFHGTVSVSNGPFGIQVGETTPVQETVHPLAAGRDPSDAAWHETNRAAKDTPLPAELRERLGRECESVWHRVAPYPIGKIEGASHIIQNAWTASAEAIWRMRDDEVAALKDAADRKECCEGCKSDVLEWKQRWANAIAERDAAVKRAEAAENSIVGRNATTCEALLRSLSDRATAGEQVEETLARIIGDRAAAIKRAMAAEKETSIVRQERDLAIASRDDQRDRADKTEAKLAQVTPELERLRRVVVEYIEICGKARDALERTPTGKAPA